VYEVVWFKASVEDVSLPASSYTLVVVLPSGSVSVSRWPAALYVYVQVKFARVQPYGCRSGRRMEPACPSPYVVLLPSVFVEEAVAARVGCGRRHLIAVRHEDAPGRVAVRGDLKPVLDDRLFPEASYVRGHLQRRR
jgi:hypothetical protein